MEQYLVSARKYRPSTFASVVGQKALATTLKNAISSDRLAHAYLFCGSRGVGKTSCARIFAKTINCTNRTADGEACNECESCRQFNENRSLNIMELDAASNNSVDDIRQLNDQVQVPPSDGKYRVFIVDEVHMLSTQAFNAFLKTLEEPPSYVIFILATTEKHKVIPTILSRCQIYDFNRITVNDMIEHLQYVAQNEGITAESAALGVIARKADGAMRDALSIFDQVAASSLNNITYQSTIDSLNVLDSAYYNRLLESFLTGNVSDALLIYKEIRDKGFNNHFFLSGLADYFRDLVVARDPKTIELLETDSDHRNKMAELAAKCSPRMLYRAMDLCNTADMNYRTAANKQFLVELTLIKLCQADSPSPNDFGDGEGQKLQPITATKPTQQPNPQPKTQPQPQPEVKLPQPPQPTVKPQQPAQPKAAPKVAIGLGPTISIKSAAASPIANTQPSSTATAVGTHRSEDYSDAQLAATWAACAAANPAAVALNNILKSCPPRRTQGDNFVVGVTSEAQQKILHDSLPEIHAFIRKRLLNDDITITPKLIEGDAAPEVWTDTQVLEHLMKENDQLRRLSEEFKLTME
ncbi:MAG: DNA polymerase III subunit gamma/tau [Bacteroides sp.]|nr:DNA polymerase III subunit gamma/tau [Bacteroides sp.]MCM1378727.1 DNA polymerase III subunit gamma/tau [Bacteroides sp.]MCM1445000.1 DNA polymerase III subunit gamma/tau [Prevotella sp.]